MGGCRRNEGGRIGGKRERRKERKGKGVRVTRERKE